MTAIDFMADFLTINKAKYKVKEYDEEVRLWLELLELVVLISYRKAEVPTLFSTDSTMNELQRVSDSKQAERRIYWLSVRQDISAGTENEYAIYRKWGDTGARSSSGTYSNNHLKPAKKLSSISPLFFTISAKIASFIDQDISEKWMELAAQFMLHAALESCLICQEDGSIGDLLAFSFAWGWIPSSYWDAFGESRSDKSIEAEMVINTMFEDNDGQEARENQTWREKRLQYLSLFNVSGSSSPPIDKFYEQAEKITYKYPIVQFESQLMEFLREMWKFCRKPLLVQIEEGEVEGIPQHDFEDFKKRIFAPN